MRYQLAPLYCRPWTLNGISARLIESHYENNYGAALNRLNAISEEIERLDLGSAPNPSLARLKRDEIVALNSTLLHELYFASLGGDGRVVPDALASAIAKDFGSVDRWRQEFVGIAAGLAGGSGWVLLTYVPRDGRLINQISSEHNQSIAGGVPILALDMYEHAYHLEFGANAGIRRERRRLHRCLHAQHRLVRRKAALRRCRQGRATAAPRAKGVCRRAVDLRRGSPRDDEVGDAGS